MWSESLVLLVRNASSWNGSVADDDIGRHRRTAPPAVASPAPNGSAKAKGQRHWPEQFVAMLRDAGAMLNTGQEPAAVVQSLTTRRGGGVINRRARGKTWVLRVISGAPVHFAELSPRLKPVSHRTDEHRQVSQLTIRQGLAIKCTWQNSNLRPHPCQGCALTN